MADAEAIAATVPAKTKKPESLEHNPSEGKPTRQKPVTILDNPHDIDLNWRRATFTLGAGLVWLSVVRLTCDSKVLSVLAVRSQKFDAIFTSVIGAFILFLSSSVDSLGS